MQTLTIAIGSKRGPKVNAVRDALDALSASFPAGTRFEIFPVEVQSGVSHTPASREELMRGARQRAEALIRAGAERGVSWDYFVGLEGGLDVVPATDASSKVQRRVFLESWAYVSDGTHGHYGRSGGIEIPEALAHEVLENGVELAHAIDRFAGAAGIRDGQGAWGVLSGNIISRQEAFRVAVIAAFAPFYNARMYSGTALGVSAGEGSR
jgi:inosine/xanthosine triphosphatase